MTILTDSRTRFEFALICQNLNHDRFVPKLNLTAKIKLQRLWVQLKTFMYDMFDPIINIIGTPCSGMSIVFNKMRSFHQMLK